MADETQRIFNLLQNSTKAIANYDVWKYFLKTAAWHFKYPFNDQVLIFAQKSEATACAGMDDWVNKTHRWVSKDAKPIALVRENGSKYYLEYVFDISDTRSYGKREIKLWQYDDRYESAVMQTLKQYFGDTASAANIRDAIINASYSAVEDRKAEYLHDLKYAKGGSFLSGMDDVNLDLRFRQTAKASVVYMIMQRMGLRADDVIDEYDLQYIRDFNTPETMSILGNAVSTIAEDALRDIARTIHNEQKKEKFAEKENSVYNDNEKDKNDVQEERTDKNGRSSNIHESRRFSDAELDSTGGGISDRQIRNDAEDISENTASDTVLPTDDERRTPETLGGDRQDNNTAGTDNSIADGESRGHNGSDEVNRPVTMDGTNEQLTPFSGGNRIIGNGVQLSIFDMVLPTEAEQKEYIMKAEQVQGSAFSMPQQIIDEVLTTGGNDSDSVLNICIEYSKNKSSSENIEFLKDEYGTGSKGFIFDGNKVSVWWNSDGIRIAYGERADGRGELISWERTEKRIGELLELGRFAPQETLDQIGEAEYKKATTVFYNMYRSTDTDKYPDLLKHFNTEWFSNIYPDTVNRVSELFRQTENINLAINAVDEVNKVYANDKYAVAYTVYAPDKVKSLLKDLQLEHRTFTANEYQKNTAAPFITEDEIDNLMASGSNVDKSKFRIYLYFDEHTDTKERIAFLKNEYGTGGHYSGIFNESHDSSGIVFSRGDIISPYAKVNITWSAAVKRIDSLIKSGKYLSQTERSEGLHKYLSEQEQQKIRNEKYSYLNGMDKLPPEELRQTLPKRIRYFIDLIDDNDKQCFEHCWLENLLNETEIGIGEAIKNGETRLWLIETMNKINNTTSNTMAKYWTQQFVSELSEIKSVTLEKVGDFYEIYGSEAEEAAAILDLTLTSKVIDDERLSMVGFPSHIAERYAQTLNSNGYLVAFLEDNKEQETVEKIFYAYALTIVSKVVNDESYINACLNSDKENAKLECDAAVKRAILTFSSENRPELYKMYFDMPEFQEIIHNYSFEQTYDIIRENEMDVPITDEPQQAQAPQDAPDVSLTALQQKAADIDKKYENLSMQEKINIIAQSFCATTGKIETHPCTGKWRGTSDMSIKFDNGMSFFIGNAATPKAKTVKVQKTYIDACFTRYNPEIISAAKEAAIYALRKREIRDNAIAEQKGLKPYTLLNVEFNDGTYDKSGRNMGWYYVTIAVDGKIYSHIETGLNYDISSGKVSEMPTRKDYFVAGGLKETDVDYVFNNVGHSSASALYSLPISDEVRERAENTLAERVAEADNVEKISVIEEQTPAQTELPPPNIQRPQPVQNTVIYPEIPQSERHNFTITDDELGYGTASEKYAANVAAIRTLKQVEAEHRLATPEEQEKLSRYVGWGGLADCFEEKHSKYNELKALLTDDEYEQARTSVLTSHYTPPVVIRSMYKAMERMGFKQGNILEPSCGIGNFMGLMPENFSDSKIYGIEIDSITGRIAQQLYQKNSVAIQGFEDSTLPDSFFDVAIGNVPFGNFKVMEKKYDKHNFLIHDFFFAKTLDKVRPGGIVAFITSSGTMDKQNSKVRKYIAQRADLVGAIRLPNNTFKKNAGTEVTADILFLQKRDRIVDIEPDWVHVGQHETGQPINQYFLDNPDMVLGELVEESGQYGMQLNCKPYEGADLEQQLNNAIQNLQAEITEYEFDDISENDTVSIPADPDVKNFSYTIVDGDIYFRENSVMNKVELNATAQNRVKGMIEIRDCVRDLIEYQTKDFPDYEIKKQQYKLNTLYDNFTKKYGLINSRGNNTAFSSDSSYFLLCSLEELDDDGNLKRKADMFTKRTIGAKKEVTHVDTASEALAVSIGEKAKVDMEFMTTLTGKTEQELFEDLKSVIFLNPLHEEENEQYFPKYLTADEYLSGNVREKLRIAQKYAETDSAFKVNVEALEAVQPKDLTASEITVRLGTTWIPVEYIEQFTFELLNPSPYAKAEIDIQYSKLTGNWNISGKSSDKGNIKINRTYGTQRANALRIIEDTLNLRDVRIYDYVENENGNRVPVLNHKETTIAQQKQEAIKAAFDNWIWKDPDRRNTLVKMYNEKFNNIRTREYDGSHITFSGMNPEIQLRKHQKDAVARIMYGGNSLLGHVVGAGKTWTMAAAAMESKRLGLCNKPMFVVPNHLTEQWASEFLQLYPAANILVTTKKDFEMKNRKKFCGRIATGDYDAIIIGHSQFEKIPMSVARQKTLLMQQLRDTVNGIAEAKAKDAERFTVKQMERTRKSIQVKLDKLNKQDRKDDVVTFEELGVDRMFVDEAHNYKNLFLVTKMRNVGGIAQTDAQKSSDMFMKCRYLDELTGNKGNVFATGTPISNSMVELYTMQRYLQYDMLEEQDLQHFDAWASTYGETVTAIELAPEGTGYRAKTRFAKFFNIPELMNMFREVADIQTADMLKLPVPEAEYHNIAVEPTELQREMVAELGKRAEAIRHSNVDPTIDNMLKITNDGRKLALDQRLINDMLPDEDGTKVSACADNVFEIWNKTTDFKGTQLVFCDSSTPKKDGIFNVYDDIRNKLIAKGVPESDIAFIHDADTDVRKKELFAKVRSGDVRILLGSTQKMGAGTNVQTRLYASHDLDCPWRPSDVGRILRTFKIKKNVEVTDNGKIII